VGKETPPQANELELSLFGPGMGECLTIHLGFGEWMIVDSCINGATGRPIALDYLESIGVDVSKQVKLVLVTHWHDDHIRGVGQIIRTVPTARFGCSAAVKSPDFFSLMSAGKRVKLVEHTSGLDEFEDVLSTKSGGPDFWMDEGKVLYTNSSSPQVKVHALSPSAHTVTHAMGNFTAMWGAVKKGHRQPFPSVTPNDQSVVLLVETKDVHLLLGADLEAGANANTGWNAVVASTTRPKVLSSGYKVAHHGSHNGDMPGIWTHLNHKNPQALLTTYSRGKKPLPSDDDVKRLTSQSDKVYCTVWPASQRPKSRTPVDRTMNEVAKNRQAVLKRPGHIRLRVPLAGQPSDIVVDLFSNAKKL
jgi:beta-lactamase superfamily II metal-dependent hydrolase